MKAWLAGSLALLLVATVHADNIEVIDDAGHTLRLTQPARRIISLSPHLTELLYAAGAGDRLVGVAAYSDYPAAAQALPRVGDAGRFDRERILALQADLVLAWGSGNPPGEVQALRDLGLTIYVSEPGKLAAIADQLEDLGRLAGSEAQARQAAATFRARLRALRERDSGRDDISVFYQVADQPLVTVNGRHLISEVISLCGGRNVFAGLPVLAPHISREGVLQAAPEVILYGAAPWHSREDVLALWGDWADLPAVRDGQIHGVPADLLHRATPRLLEGAALVCDALAEARRER